MTRIYKSKMVLLKFLIRVNQCLSVVRFGAFVQSKAQLLVAADLSALTVSLRQ